ncbi:ornithine cyclodeaminase family protein [Pseudomonas sp. SWRI102]|uniref:Ornithine cyclodeaminase family protein n=1 Tax=Pseudomonas marvdashtae TaxID=2745500 RepID=A0A923JMW8_9PSED|nr:ornithine cyclodeaminase family protein [Pseudomonas marvdashtae]MBV4551293.1 ornithine cyclodeaminase family protein [Pseudomonas marvdashtae]
MLLLNREDIGQCVNFPRLVQALEDAHKAFALASPVAPQRLIIAHERQNAFSLFMPAFLPASQTLGVKISSFHPGNAARGLSAVNGAVLLMDIETGQLLALLDSTALTATRTSAMSALATDKLCPRVQLNLAVIGAGAQAAAHIEAIATIRELGEIKIFSRRFYQSELLAERLSTELSLSITAVRHIDEALKNADIVCTTTSHDGLQPLISAHQLKPSAHVNAIGGSSKLACEIDPELLAIAQVYVDHLGAARCESGEVAQALARSLIGEKDIQQMSELVTDNPPSISLKRGLSYFRSVGHASQDMVVAAFIYRYAMDNQVGFSCDYMCN